MALIFLTALIFRSDVAYAGDPAELFFPDRISLKGQGNTGFSIFNPAHSQLYNPALVALQEDLYVSFGSASLGMNFGSLNYFKLLKMANKIDSINNHGIFTGDDLTFYDKFNDKKSAIKAMGPLFLQLLFPVSLSNDANMVFGLVMLNQLDIKLRFNKLNPIPNYVLDGKHNLVGIGTWGIGIPSKIFIPYEGKWLVGINFKFLTGLSAKSGDENMLLLARLSKGRGNNEGITFISGGSERNRSISSDISLAFTMKASAKYTFSLKLGDVYGLSNNKQRIDRNFISDPNWTQTQRYNMRLSMGAAIEWDYFEKFDTDKIQKLKVGIELIDVGTKRNILNMFNVGTEVLLYQFLHLQLGFSNGYPAAGVGFHSKYFNVDLAYWGSNATDRVYDSVLQFWGIELGFFYD